MGLVLKRHRTRLGLTQQQCADAMHVHLQSYHAWEAGTLYPRADKLPELAALLHCSIDELYPAGGSPAHTSITSEGGRRHGA